MFLRGIKKINKWIFIVIATLISSVVTGKMYWFFSDLGNNEQFFVGPWSARLVMENGKKLIKISSLNPKHSSYLIAHTNKGLLKSDRRYLAEISCNFDKTYPKATLEFVCRSLKQPKIINKKVIVGVPAARVFLNSRLGLKRITVYRYSALTHKRV